MEELGKIIIYHGKNHGDQWLKHQKWFSNLAKHWRKPQSMDWVGNIYRKPWFYPKTMGKVGKIWCQQSNVINSYTNHQDWRFRAIWGMVSYCFTNIKGDHGLTKGNGGFYQRTMHGSMDWLGKISTENWLVEDAALKMLGDDFLTQGSHQFNEGMEPSWRPGIERYPQAGSAAFEGSSCDQLFRICLGFVQGLFRVQFKVFRVFTTVLIRCYFHRALRDVRFRF